MRPNPPHGLGATLRKCNPVCPQTRRLPSGRFSKRSTAARSGVRRSRCTHCCAPPQRDDLSRRRAAAGEVGRLAASGSPSRRSPLVPHSRAGCRGCARPDWNLTDLRGSPRSRARAPRGKQWWARSVASGRPGPGSRSRGWSLSHQRGARRRHVRTPRYQGVLRSRRPRQGISTSRISTGMVRRATNFGSRASAAAASSAWTRHHSA